MVLVNNDDDAAAGNPDNQNSVIGPGNDSAELAPLVIERTGSFTPGTTVELEISDAASIRIFGGVIPGSAEIIGPAKGARHRFANTSPSRIELSMEGIRYPRSGCAEVTLTLHTTPPGGTAAVQTATVRLAPWMIPNHLDKAERVFVVDIGNDNRRFRTELRRLAAAAGFQLVEVAQPDDRWMQDCMEFGFSSIPGKTLRTVFRAPRPRPLRTFPRTLLGTDLGYTDFGMVGPLGSTFNSAGNLEASPPVKVSGKNYPMGRIYFGPGRPGWEVDPLVRDFLHGQRVQQPIELDTNWLTVGHVDEVVTFVPAPGRRVFACCSPVPALPTRYSTALLCQTAAPGCWWVAHC